jgi:hypothetical protein
VTPDREMARVYPPCIRAIAATIARPSASKASSALTRPSAAKTRGFDPLISALRALKVDELYFVKLTLFDPLPYCFFALKPE